MSAPSCACGAPATLRVEHEVVSTRGGVAIAHGPFRCSRCGDRDARMLIAGGARVVRGVPLA